MPVLRNPKHELVAQGFASGKKAKDCSYVKLAIRRVRYRRSLFTQFGTTLIFTGILYCLNAECISIMLKISWLKLAVSARRYTAPARSLFPMSHIIPITTDRSPALISLLHIIALQAAYICIAGGVRLSRSSAFFSLGSLCQF